MTRSPYSRFRSALCCAALVFATGHATAAPPQARPRTPDVPLASTKHSPVAPALAKKLATGAAQDYVIELSDRADLSAATAMGWMPRGRYVVAQLKASAERSQAPVLRALHQRGLHTEAHWIKNVIVVRGGDAASVKLAAALPGVARIRDMPQARLVRPEPGQRLVHKRGDAGIGVAPNIARIGAPQAWAQGTRGHGVTVGVIDTGAWYTHETLRRQYRGWRGGNSFEHDYNWFFPRDRSAAPVANDTHGTHVTGTILGDDFATDPAERDRIGVAPGAQWISCLGLPTDSDAGPSLLSCGEFMLAPTRTDGSDPRPDLRPQVVNNSWSENNCDGSGSSFYADMVDAWIAAGIFPVFAAGNAFSCELPQPPPLASVSSPAALPQSFAVGSTGNHDGEYADHSLWGPSDQPSPGLPTLPDPRGFPQLKPQVVAPGVDIVSAYDAADDSYGTMTGTSMSAPHIAGLVALMLEAGDCLVGDYATLGTLIMSTAKPTPYATGGLPAPGPGNVPNYATGWGEIDAAAAVEAAAAACGPQGFVQGTITDAQGNAIAGAHVELFVEEAVRIWSLDADTDGSYIRRLPENTAGGYRLRVTAYGYRPFEQDGIQVTHDHTTPLDVQLTSAPLATVQGKVTDAATGWPLHARLIIAGYPGGALWTDAASGQYNVQLPVAAAYRVDVDSDIAGYQARTLNLVVAADATHDIALTADPIACTAPGYDYTQTRFTEAFEAGSPPAGWSLSSAGKGWLFGTFEELHDSARYPLQPRAGRFAANIDLVPDGSNDARTDYLVSPPIDLAGATHPALRFASRYWTGYVRAGNANVQASTDEGVTWHALGQAIYGDGWIDQSLSLAAYAGQRVRLRFHFDDGSSDDQDAVTPGWTVDDVRVVAGCSAPAGGSLVVGNVRDANTRKGLDGAQVSIGDETMPTYSSEEAGAGFFALYANPADTSVTASRGTQPEGYGDAQQTLSVGNGNTLHATLDLPAGRFELDPAAPAATVELGQVKQVPVALRNTGTRELHFGFEGVHLEEHFDALDFPPAGWDVLEDETDCGWSLLTEHNEAGGDGNAAKIDLVPCGEALGRVDYSLLLPALDLSHSATASIGFFLVIYDGPGAEPRFRIQASTDAGTSWSDVYDRHHGTNFFELLEADLTPFAGQPSVQVRLRFEANAPYAGVQIDQVHLFRELGHDGSLALAPATGTLAAGGELAAQATFDARGVAQPGSYTVPIRLGEDTPYAHTLGEISGTMTVTAPASFGRLAGTLRSLGRCEANPYTLADWPLRITAANGDVFETRTGIDGRYEYWLDATHGPYTVQVEGDAHVAATRNAVVTAGVETSLDIDLRPRAACLAADPVAVDLSSPAGQSASAPFDLANLGPLAARYSARIGGDPSQRSALALTQNSASELEAFAAFGCATATHSVENRWYRVYPLAERQLGETSVLVDAVNFGADSATSTAGEQTLEVALYTLQGEFLRANLTPIASTTLRVADTALGLLQARFEPAAEVASDATLVVEIVKPDGEAGGSVFYLAGNQADDIAPAYLYAPGCGFDEPMSYDDAGFGHLSPVLDLETRASDACGAAAIPVPWLGVRPANGNVAADGLARLEAIAQTQPVGVHRGAICIAAPAAHDDGLLIPVKFNVQAPQGEDVFADGFE